MRTTHYQPQHFANDSFELLYTQVSWIIGDSSDHLEFCSLWCSCFHSLEIVFARDKVGTSGFVDWLCGTESNTTHIPSAEEEFRSLASISEHTWHRPKDCLCCSYHRRRRFHLRSNRHRRRRQQVRLLMQISSMLRCSTYSRQCIGMIRPVKIGQWSLELRNSQRMKLWRRWAAEPSKSLSCFLSWNWL